MDRTEPSDITSFERIGLDRIESPVVRQGVRCWSGLRGERRYPDYGSVRPRDFVAILAHTMLVKVIDGGADFEFRIVGNAQMQTYALPFAGKRLSALVGSNAAYGYVIKGLLAHVTALREPVALRGQFGPGFDHVNLVYCETAFLPLGASDEAVDHILVFTAYSPRQTR